jgi:hypothetical protein
MNDGDDALILVIVFIVAALLFARRRWALVDDAELGLPAELRGVEIAFAERTFRSRRHRLVARLDRAYRTPAGIQLVELKTRSRNVVYLADVIELSVQRIALEDETGEAVSDQAWVMVQHSRSGRRSPHRVRLLGIQEVTAMRERYAAIVHGRVARPASAGSASQCRQCAHRAMCAARHQDRT